MTNLPVFMWGDAGSGTSALRMFEPKLSVSKSGILISATRSQIGCSKPIESRPLLI